MKYFDYLLSLLISFFVLWILKDSPIEGFTFSRAQQYIYLVIVFMQAVPISIAVNFVQRFSIKKLSHYSMLNYAFYFSVILHFAWFFLLMFNLQITKRYSTNMRALYFDDKLCSSEDEKCAQNNKKILDFLEDFSKTATKLDVLKLKDLIKE
tara:strand:- start:1 stop:456 length:456 start_codon:yes stop_codon:yes gene_type:complete